jgi:CheY-like chemotaxis protein
VLRTLLTGSGYEMIEAADGQAGVAKARAERPDLVLVDISSDQHRNRGDRRLTVPTLS